MAAIQDYATLQTTIADYLARSDLTTFIPNFVQNCENKLYRTLNLRNEETALSVSISTGTAAVPADFKALKFAYFDGDKAYPLDWVTLTKLYEQYPVRSGAETPCLISREAGNFIFGPSSKDGTLRGVYYAKQSPLRTVDNSWYVENAADVLLYGSLLEAKPFIKDDARIPIWLEFYRDGVRSLKTEEDNSAVSKGSIRQRTGVNVV